MNDYFIRDCTESDIPALVGLWTRNFGDPEAMVSEFLRALPDIGGAVAAEKDGRLVGMALALTGMELAGSKDIKSPVLGYIYAVAVDEGFRKRGIGEGLTRSAADLARRREAEIICVEPASPELFAWYEKILGVKCVLRRSRRELKSASTEQTMALSSTEYMLWRENMLRDVPHIHHSNHSLEAQRKMLSSFGGGFYATESGIAAACVEGGTAVIKELLCTDKSRISGAAASVGAALGCENTLLYQSDSRGSPYMAADREFPDNCAWNLSFD